MVKVFFKLCFMNPDALKNAEPVFKSPYVRELNAMLGLLPSGRRFGFLQSVYVLAKASKYDADTLNDLAVLFMKFHTDKHDLAHMAGKLRDMADELKAMSSQPDKVTSNLKEIRENSRTLVDKVALELAPEKRDK